MVVQTVAAAVVALVWVAWVVQSQVVAIVVEIVLVVAPGSVKVVQLAPENAIACVLDVQTNAPEVVVVHVQEAV